MRLRLLRWARLPFRRTRRWTRVELWIVRQIAREQGRVFEWPL